MLGSCPVVSHQVSTADARAQELPTEEFRVTVVTFEAEGAASDAATAELREGRRHAEEVLQATTETRREAWWWRVSGCRPPCRVSLADYPRRGGQLGGCFADTRAPGAAARGRLTSPGIVVTMPADLTQSQGATFTMAYQRPKQGLIVRVNNGGGRATESLSEAQQRCMDRSGPCQLRPSSTARGGYSGGLDTVPRVRDISDRKA
jgi:hypothetical protein